MNYNTYANEIYPCNIYITNCDNVLEILKDFAICKNDNFWEIDNVKIDGFQNFIDNCDACCVPVKNSKTKEFGILLILKNKDTKVIAHESIHIADYIFDYCGLHAESYADGNESYAYLVGWIVGCILKFIKNGNTK